MTVVAKAAINTGEKRGTIDHTAYMINSRNPEIAAYLAACDRALQGQLAEMDRVQTCLSLPLPRNTEQWEALKGWLDELQRETGKTIRIEFAAPSSETQRND